MTTDVGSFKSYQLIEGRTTPVSVRVSPTEKIRAEIDALFAGDRELGVDLGTELLGGRYSN